MADEHYENLTMAQIYDLDSPWSVDRDFYLALAARPSMTILDLGCGTGLLCNAYAEEGHRVVGADPAAAMLEVAKKKPYGESIQWVQSTAQEFRSQDRFDLIIMTGHAFQVLIDDSDVLAALSVMQKHLATDGIAVFESRNPNIDWAKRWDYVMNIDMPTGKVKESRRMLEQKGERMTFELKYEFENETQYSRSELRFMPYSKIKELIQAAGLEVVQIYGDWDKSPFDENVSEEMIFCTRRAEELDSL
jgi:ubiquinone/menaquinone biosynthesis C-methylase UbiE